MQLYRIKIEADVYAASDWDEIKKRICCDGTKIAKRKIKSYDSHYDNETLQIVSEIYKRDLELFDYEF